MLEPDGALRLLRRRQDPTQVWGERGVSGERTPLVGRRAKPHAALWPLDRGVGFSTTAPSAPAPRRCSSIRRRCAAEMEAEPVRFLARELDDRARRRPRGAGRLPRRRPDDLAFVTNATSGVNAVLRSLRVRGRRRAAHHRSRLQRVPQRARLRRRAHGRARGRRAASRFPLASPDDVVDAVLATVTPRTRLALLDHVTSPTALVLPIERLIAELGRRGVDDAGRRRPRARAWCRSISARSAPPTTAATATSGCARPRARPFSGCGAIASSRGPAARPSATAPARRAPDRSRFRLEFDWTGTSDPTALAHRAEGDRLRRHARPGRLARGDGDEPRPGARGARRSCARPRARRRPAPTRWSARIASVVLPDGPTLGHALAPARPDPAAALRRLEHRGAGDALARPAPPPDPRLGPALQQRGQYARLAEALGKELAAERR